MKYLMKAYWWKLLTVILLIYTVIGGFLMPAPRLPILNETIRILHFHVPMWFGMIIMFSGFCILCHQIFIHQKFDVRLVCRAVGQYWGHVWCLRHRFRYGLG